MIGYMAWRPGVPAPRASCAHVSKQENFGVERDRSDRSGESPAGRLLILPGMATSDGRPNGPPVQYNTPRLTGRRIGVRQPSRTPWAPPCVPPHVPFGPCESPAELFAGTPLHCPESSVLEPPDFPRSPGPRKYSIIRFIPRRSPPASPGPSGYYPGCGAGSGLLEGLFVGDRGGGVACLRSCCSRDRGHIGVRGVVLQGVGRARWR